MFNADERKNGSARRFCCERLSDSVNSYTIEVSMGGFYVKGTGIATTYIEEGCILCQMKRKSDYCFSKTKLELFSFFFYPFFFVMTDVMKRESN